VTSIPEIWGDFPPIRAYAYFPALDESFRWEVEGGVEEIGNVISRVDAVITMAKAPDSPVVPGPWCDYCNHLPRCEAVQRETESVLAVSSDALLANPERAVELFDMGQRAEKALKALKEYFKTILLEAPDAFPGLQYARTNGNRVVADAAALRERLVGAGLLTDEELDSCEEPATIKPSKVEETFMKKRYQGRGGPTKKDLKMLLADTAGDAIAQPQRMHTTTTQHKEQTE
jgi:hypothetical protein